MSHSPLARLAGPSAVGAGVLIVAAQLAMLPFDPKDHVTTTRDPVFQIGGAVYVAGFCLLLVTLVALAERVAATGTFGTVAVLVGVLGTFLLGGDLWFETFAVPWLADRAPAALDTDPTTVLALGAFTSYVAFAAGWALVGVAALRARLFPAPLCLAISVGGLIGFQAMLAPWCVPLALAVGALGVWLLRATPAAPDARSEARPSEGQPVAG